MKNLTNIQKSEIYDNCLHESDNLQRFNSKLKSQYVGNIPSDVQKTINQNDARIAFLVKKLESLFI